MLISYSFLKNLDNPIHIFISFSFFRNFSHVLIPIQSLMTVTLPMGEGIPRDHAPFPHRQVYIQGFEDTVSYSPKNCFEFLILTLFNEKGNYWYRFFFNLNDQGLRIFESISQCLKMETISCSFSPIFLCRLKFCHPYKGQRRSQFEGVMETCTSWCVNPRMIWGKMHV